MVTLTKGQKVDLRKEAPGLKRVLVGLGWDPVRGIFSSNMDIDASVICIDEKGHKDKVVYYGKKKAYSAIKHYGDNLTGEGDGDDEQIEINLDLIPSNIQRLSIIINIYSAYSRGQHFGKVKNCYVHATDLDSGRELVQYKIDGNYDKHTGIFVADIYRENNVWNFQAIGDGCRVRDIDEMVRIKCR